MVSQWGKKKGEGGDGGRGCAWVQRQKGLFWKCINIQINLSLDSLLGATRSWITEVIAISCSGVIRC